MNLEARGGQCPVGLLRCSVACDHPAADMAAGGCSRAATECVIPLHPRATCLTDLRDHAVRLMKRHGRHCLSGGCDGQSKCNSDQPDHCHLPYEPYKKDFLEEERAPSRRLRFFANCAPMPTDQESWGECIGDSAGQCPLWVILRHRCEAREGPLCIEDVSCGGNTLPLSGMTEPKPIKGAIACGPQRRL